MRLDELPRDESGLLIGQWKLRHRAPGFGESLGSVPFADGVSTAPASGRELERIMANMGEDIDAEPWPAVVGEVEGQPEPVTQVEAPKTSATRGPGNQAELLALSEAELRVLAAKMGAVDGRWGIAKLRRFIADELNIEIGDG